MPAVSGAHTESVLFHVNASRLVPQVTIHSVAEVVNRSNLTGFPLTDAAAALVLTLRAGARMACPRIRVYTSEESKNDAGSSSSRAPLPWCQDSMTETNCWEKSW